MSSQAQSPSITIDVTPEMVDRAILSLLQGKRYDEDGDELPPTVDIKDMVRREVAKRIDKEICTSISGAVKEAVTARVALILDSGFPTYTSWGEKGPTKTMAQLVGEAVFKKDTYSDDLTAAVRKHMTRTVEQIVRDHVKALEGDIRESMKAAASEALAKWMGSVLGVKVP